MLSVLSLSYGKDSIACLEAITRLGYPLDKIITCDVFFDTDLSASFPDVVAFKSYADDVIYHRYGFKVDHVCKKRDGTKYGHLGYTYDDSEPNLTYLDIFRWIKKSGSFSGSACGWPLSLGPWCKNLKPDISSLTHFYGCDVISYLGIASDEPKRIACHHDAVLPLVDIGWSEADCFRWCSSNDLLSPSYSSSFRDGCWFCNFQPLNQLRLLRHSYPDLWSRLLLLDFESPVSFHGGCRLSDFDLRFRLEDEGFIDPSIPFHVSYLSSPFLARQLSFFD